MYNRHSRFAAIIAIIMCFTLGLTILSPKVDASAKRPSEESKPVQVFDVKAGKVVKSETNDKQYQKFARDWIGSVTGLAPQLTNDDSCSYIYRIPLDKPATIKTDGVSVKTQDVFLFTCDGKAPTLLVFDEQRRPYLLLFKADIAPFVKKIGVPET
ncbi:hypothetical protein [Paenibacillus sp. NPDC058071]|uniref:hypothetical protein n=1 Tax=Paenibacillus sp. NPDC058071 TaxID=3346326 RepID=UPI0036DB6C8B